MVGGMLGRGGRRRTVKVALAVNGQAPAGVLGQRVQHVVEEADARVDGNRLRLAALRGVGVLVGEQAGVGVGRECAAVNVEGHLDLGLVGVAGERGPARVGRCRHDWKRLRCVCLCVPVYFERGCRECVQSVVTMASRK